MTKQARMSDRIRVGVLPAPSRIEWIIEQFADLAVAIDRDGRVLGLSVSPESPYLGCLDHWVGRDFREFLTEDSRSKFEDRIATVLADPDAVVRPMELNHVDNANWEFPIRYTIHDAGEDHGILLLGRDMQPFADIQQRLVREQLARERDAERFRGVETRYRVVFDASETPMAMVEPDTGRALDLNRAAMQLLSVKTDNLSANAFAQCFEGRRKGEFGEALKAAAAADDAQGVSTVLRRTGADVRLCPEFFRASGEVSLLCRILPVLDEDQSGREFQRALSQLYESTSDAIVLTDAKGAVREANEGFLRLTDAAQLRDVQGRPLADFLARGAVDMKLIFEQLDKTGRLRGYAAQVESVVGMRATVDISAARLNGRTDRQIGFILREASATQAISVAEAGATMSEEAMTNVMDLVGTASLKELVGATTDVVEKLCIETAVRLTDNNRVAAAEMLGLSRQSLYVKLRKYGLLDNSADAGRDE
ncbi:transcriptional regulator PpsR [Rhodosalinus sp.]|uniref:transcriptional regulator PpsR n=1 Tax=Rhodosalinus sp. TaxID=2047741 RepID=UPI003569A615